MTIETYDDLQQAIFWVFFVLEVGVALGIVLLATGTPRLLAGVGFLLRLAGGAISFFLYRRFPTFAADDRLPAFLAITTVTDKVLPLVGLALIGAALVLALRPKPAPV